MVELKPGSPIFAEAMIGGLGCLEKLSVLTASRSPFRTAGELCRAQTAIWSPFPLALGQYKVWTDEWRRLSPVHELSKVPMAE